MSYICKQPGAAMLNQLLDDGHGNYTGQCVSLLKRMCPTLPPTALWKKGVAVKKATILPGTAIATFNQQGKYYGHAAIYVSQDVIGITVWDQYNHPPKGVGKRTITFDDKKSVVNNGSAYFVID